MSQRTASQADSNVVDRDFSEEGEYGDYRGKGAPDSLGIQLFFARL
jgi:hypothetical protein